MKLAIVIPCFRAADTLGWVLDRIGSEADTVYLVDDACPQGSVTKVMAGRSDPRLRPLFLPENQGVGGAVKAGYRAAMQDGHDIVVKLDSDGQMDPRLVPGLISPIVNGHADYAKGNRFFSLEDAAQMPVVRFIGNFFLSFISKLSSGYWNVFDPTNGFTAIHKNALALLSLDKIDDRYFFESDMLFRLNTVEAVVMDVPMKARYADEESGLKPGRELFRFSAKHAVRLFKRVSYRYFLRGMSAGSVFLLTAIVMAIFSAAYSFYFIGQSAITGIPSSPGQVMLGGISFLIAVQSAVAFLVIDVNFEPRTPLQRRTVLFLDVAGNEPSPSAGRHGEGNA